MKPVNGKKNDAAVSSMRKDTRDLDGSRVYYLPQELVDSLNMSLARLSDQPYHGGLEVIIPFGLFDLKIHLQFSHETYLNEEGELPYLFEVSPILDELNFEYHPDTKLFKSVNNQKTVHRGDFHSIEQFCAYFHNTIMIYASKINGIDLASIGLDQDSQYWKDHAQELEEYFYLTEREVRIKYADPRGSSYHTYERFSMFRSTIPKVGHAASADTGCIECLDYEHFYDDIRIGKTNLSYLYCIHSENTADYLDLRLSFRGAIDDWDLLGKAEKVQEVNKLLTVFESKEIEPHEMHDIIHRKLGKSLIETLVFDDGQKADDQVMLEIQLRIVPEDYYGQWGVVLLELGSQQLLTRYLMSEDDELPMRGLVKKGLFKTISLNEIDRLAKNYPKLLAQTRWELFKIGNHNHLMLMMECLVLTIREADQGRDLWQNTKINGVSFSVLFGLAEQGVFKSGFLMAIKNQLPYHELWKHFEAEVLQWFINQGE